MKTTLLIILVLALTLATGGCAKKAEAKTTATAKSDPYPHTLTELNNWYAVPGSDDAGPTYEKAFALLTPNVNASAAESDAAAAQCLRANTAAFGLLLDAAPVESCRYSVDLTKGIEAPFPHLPKIKSAAALLNAAAVVHSQARDSKRAAQDTVAAFALARSLSGEPSALSQSTRVAAIARATHALQTVLNRASLAPDSLESLTKMLRDMEASESRGDPFLRALVSERVVTMALLDQPAKILPLLDIPGQELSADQRQKITNRVQSGGKLKEEQQLYASLIAELIDARQQPFPARFKQDTLVDQCQFDAKKYPVLGLFLPGLKNLAAKEAESLTNLRLALLAVDVEQRRQSDNKYPASLAEIPAAPLDPFTGKSFDYRVTDTGFTLTSSGSDKKGALTFAVQRKSK
jgi:hypothetical protein